MKLLRHLRTDWFKNGFETIAVVVGILATFALDNWYEDRKQESIEEVKNLFSLSSWNSEQLTTQNSTYIDLTNSGSLGMISDPVLRDLMINYYRENERASAHIVEFNEVSSPTLLQVNFVIQNYNKFQRMADNLYADETRYFEGEWHLGHEKEDSPHRTGFGESFVLLPGGGSHYADRKP